MNASERWQPVNHGTLTIENGAAELRTNKLGTYALMMRHEVSIEEVALEVKEAAASMLRYLSTTQDGAAILNGMQTAAA